MHKCSAGLAVMAIAIVLSGLGCGDNSRDCGPGTIEEGGHCLPAGLCGFGTREDPATGECVPDGSVVCSNGTVFDVLTGSCKIDPTACQNGTVLIEDACVDPTSNLVIDAQEGPEPNGLGFIEQSLTQAGNITLKGVGNGAYVVHGTIDPWRDFNSDGTLEPDVDTYIMTTQAPTFVRITADGVGGTAAGFVAIAEVEPDDALADWQRVGLSLVSDTSVRQVFLPRAGTYRLAIADTRTLLEYVTAGFATAAPGGDTSEYYVALTEQAPPAPTLLPVSNSTATVTSTLASDQLAVYAVPLGTGLNAVRLTMPSPLATAAFVVTRNGEFAIDAVETSSPARALVGGITPTTNSLIVVEQAYTLLPTSVAFTLDVTISNAAVLSTTGGMTTAPATTNVGSELARLNMWSFDVATDNAVLGMQITWTPAVVGEIYDGEGEIAASFTSPSSNVTWSTYRGLVRLPRAGRYYFAVYAPSASSASTLSVTSTITEITPAPITSGTPLTAPVNAFRSVPFTYAAGTAPWQQFDVTGVNTGGQTASLFDPAFTYGRLDSLTTSAGTFGPNIPPIFSFTYPTAGGPRGRVVLGDATQSYLVKVTATAPTTSPAVTLTFQPRANATDLGFTTTAVSRSGQTLDPTTPQRLYLVRTPAGKLVTITVTTTSSVNTQFRRLQSDETALGALINTSTNGADVETFTQNSTEWTAFVVSSAGNLSGSRTFDVTVSVQ